MQSFGFGGAFIGVGLGADERQRWFKAPRGWRSTDQGTLGRGYRQQPVEFIERDVAEQDGGTGSSSLDSSSPRRAPDFDAGGTMWVVSTRTTDPTTDEQGTYLSSSHRQLAINEFESPQGIAVSPNASWSPMP
jgi:hypothetical protein